MKIWNGLFTALLLVGTVCQAAPQPATFCRSVPERKDDFAWENDKIAFRTYGPALKDSVEDSGFDCWLKRVDYSIINKWYNEAETQGKSYHKDHGEGYDGYKVGSSRGCGGLGLWLDGKVIISNVYKSWMISKCTTEESVFILRYEWEYKGDTYREEKQISIKLGDRLFKATSTFWKNGKLAVGLPIAVGLATHNGAAVATYDLSAGWMAAWETIDGSGLGVGVVMKPAAIDQFILLETKEKDKSHALFITKTDTKGKVEYYAGYGWERAGEIKTSQEWNQYLKQFAKQRIQK